MKKIPLLYGSDPGLLLGFHGCDKSVAEGVIAGRIMLHPSVNKYDWLGPGIYFWQNNYERAMEFAWEQARRGKVSEPAVIGAVISLDNCLDLLDKQCIDVLKDFALNSIYEVKTIFDFVLKKQHPIPETGKNNTLLRVLDNYYIESLHDEREMKRKPPFDTVRCAFIEGAPIYPGAGFYEKSHIQICIRNPNCIKGFFNPREEMEWPVANKAHSEEMPSILS
ncbi:MAG: hypothetical protein JO154_25175 [Chitinophaga sp.]|uniref:hypothetical protein n=1 Tax=Chitinophaga sp. TaxID=1869181 RepID=UPI0025C37F01|nr:hypothetical protein [Chitinophaga sp.]MBV8255912.1 hypothetical protein [Chitinophaga sp.]